MPFVTLDAVAARSPDGRSLFENLSLILGRERTGLVGRNGVGKTTLLHVILGKAQPAAGSVSVSGRLAILRQGLEPAPGVTVADLLGVTEALARLDRLERGEPLADDLERADWMLPARLEAALADMGLAGVSLGRAAASLSGGEATRAALAGLLVGEPDLLLLDEPTNNLDAAARETVAAMLERWKGGALVISHDRTLLRRMDRIVELSGLGARVYGGDYDLYANARLRRPPRRPANWTLPNAPRAESPARSKPFASANSARTPPASVRAPRATRPRCCSTSRRGALKPPAQSRAAWRIAWPATRRAIWRRLRPRSNGCGC